MAIHGNRHRVQREKSASQAIPAKGAMSQATDEGDSSRRITPTRPRDQREARGNSEGSYNKQLVFEGAGEWEHQRLC